MSVLTTILSNIPWGQVVESAPKIAQGAGRLWDNVKNRGAEPADPTSTGTSEPTTDLQQLQTRTQALESQVQALQDEMRSSALLVKQLAEQTSNSSSACKPCSSASAAWSGWAAWRWCCSLARWSGFGCAKTARPGGSADLNVAGLDDRPPHPQLVLDELQKLL